MTSVNAKQEALLDELLKDYTSPQDILGEHGLLKQLTKRVVERVLERIFPPIQSTRSQLSRLYSLTQTFRLQFFPSGHSHTREGEDLGERAVGAVQ